MIYIKPFNWPEVTKFDRLQAVKYFVIHHSAYKGDIDIWKIHGLFLDKTTQVPVYEWHLANDWKGVGYHFLIRKNGDIEGGRPDWAQGAHVLGYNNVSLGICVAGDFRYETPEPAQIQSLIELILYLWQNYPAAKVVRHMDLSPTECPGPNFPWEDFQVRLRQAKDEAEKVKEYIVSPDAEIEEAVRLAREKGLSKAPKGWDYTKPLSEERFWVIIKRLMRW